MCIFKLTGTIMHSIYSPHFMALIGIAALLRLGCPISQSDFFCICVYMTAVWTAILHSCCRLPFCTLHIMNLLKQNNSHWVCFFPICFSLPPSQQFSFYIDAGISSVVALSCFLSCLCTFQDGRGLGDIEHWWFTFRIMLLTLDISRSVTSIFKSKDLTDDYTSYV